MSTYYFGGARLRVFLRIEFQFMAVSKQRVSTCVRIMHFGAYSEIAGNA
jgi:hypothetical protein